MIGRTYLERGAPVVVLTRWGRTGRGACPLVIAFDQSKSRRRAPHNVLKRRQSGSQVVRPFRGLRVPNDGRPA